MKLTLIKPKIGRSENGLYREKAVMEPLELGIIAGLTPPDIEVVLYDDRIESIPFDEPTDLVAVTVGAFTAKRAYEISHEYRLRGVQVIMGGYHPSHIPDEVLAHANSVYIGDAEDLWLNVISDARRGRLASIYRAKCTAPSEQFFPRRDIYKGKRYLPVTLIQFSRGCQYGCNFCSISSFRRRQYFVRPVSNVIEEIEHQNRKWLLFADDNIVMNMKTAKELFRALIPMRIHWFSEGSVNMAGDPELMDLMMKSGCIGHLIGFESINRQSLLSMRKTPNLSGSDQYNDQLKIIQAHGLPIWATFTLGHGFDTLETIESTLEFSMKYKFALADYNVLTPYPNTPLFKSLESENRLLYDGKWWLHPDYRFGHATFRPHNMSADDLTQGCFDAYKRFYSITDKIFYS